MTQQKDCPLCPNPLIQQVFFQPSMTIAELDVSTAFLRPTFQFYRGYSVLALRQHVTELWELNRETRAQFIEDANRLAMAIKKAFGAVKINYAILGNTADHLHWHLIPRYSDDPDPTHNIWSTPTPEITLSEDEFGQISSEIRGCL